MTLSALDDSQGNLIDWWFIYKLPYNVTSSGGGTKTTGKEYLYFDSSSKEKLSLSANEIDDDGALKRTLNQLASDNKPGYILYNDERPDAGSDSDTYGHTKGVLAFDQDSDSGFWILHSWPKFPDLDMDSFPSLDYGQTFICITLKDFDTVNAIADQLYLENEPQVYASYAPDSLDNTSNLYALTQKKTDVNEKGSPCDITFYSKGGQLFRMLAKNRAWDKDFWIDWVGPQLGLDLEVETWRRGTIPPTEDSDGKGEVSDILYINLESLGLDYEWHYTKDHSKWAVSTEKNWVCVADINRQTSQEDRGGGTIAFQNDLLWESLSEIAKFKE